jgi:DNA ligase (NAD+)
MEDKIEQMREMVARLNAAADAYYNGRGELMTDFEWDALFDKVKTLETETGVVLPDSPTNRVSSDDVAGQKETHEFAALSLAKTKKTADVAKWAEGRLV